jgi:hypothetical protein
MSEQAKVWNRRLDQLDAYLGELASESRRTTKKEKR